MGMCTVVFTPYINMMLESYRDLHFDWGECDGYVYSCVHTLHQHDA